MVDIDEMKLTLGIPTRNRSAVLEKCLNSICKQDVLPHEVIVIDDAGEEDTAQMLKRNIAPFNALGIKLVGYRFTSRQRQPSCRNYIVNISEGDILVFLDDDVEMETGWLRALVEPFSDPSVGGVGGPAIKTDEELNILVDIDRSSQNQNWVNSYGVQHSAFHCWIPPEIVETDTLIGANMAFRKEAYFAIDGSDTNFLGPAYSEETDLCLRVKKAGYKLLYNPAALVYHKFIQSGGSRHRAEEFWYWEGANLIYVLKKNFAQQQWRWILRLIFGIKRPPTPIFGIVIAALLRERSINRLYQIKGYWDTIFGRIEYDKHKSENVAPYNLLENEEIKASATAA